MKIKLMKDKGYTLIESLVVLAIVAIVAGMVFGAIKAAKSGDGRIDPYFNPEAARAQALQEQNDLKEREIQLMQENNRLMREMLERNK